jgi:type IV pilus assembly protein PilN
LIRINLLPRELIEKKKIGAFVVFVSISSLFSVLICVLLFLPLRDELQAAKRRLELERLTLRKYRPILQELEELKREESELQVRLTSVENLIVSRSPWSQVLYEISRALPEKIWLTELTKETQGKEQILAIEGSSLSKTIDIGKFMENLTKSPLFTEVALLGMTKRAMDKREVMDFAISCKLRGFVPFKKEL